MDHTITRKVWVFFEEHKTSGKTFTKQDLTKATGWSPSTVQTYYNKKWRKHLAKEGGTYRVIGFDGFTLEAFIELHSQVSH